MGPVCPHCRSIEYYRLSPKAESKSPARKGSLKCRKCRKLFSATVGTIFQGSHLPLVKWLIAVYLVKSLNQAMSLAEFQRALGVTYKSARQIAHLIRFHIDAHNFKAILAAVADRTFVNLRGLARPDVGRCAFRPTVKDAERFRDTRDLLLSIQGRLEKEFGIWAT